MMYFHNITLYNRENKILYSHILASIIICVALSIKELCQYIIYTSKSSYIIRVLFVNI